MARKRVLERAAGGPVVFNGNKPLGSASAFVWREPETIPRREFLYGGHYLRGFVTATIAPGGVGKSANAIMECLAMVTGYPLPHRGMAGKRLRVWYVNLEDPLDEIQRRFQAAMKHYRIRPEEVAGRLFIDSGHDKVFVFASENRTGVAIAAPVVESVTASMRENGIDALMLDPFISTHEVDENSNSKVQQVVTQFAQIAKATGASVELISHTKKMAGREVTADDSRGASALHDKVRSLRTVNKMTQEEGQKAGLQKSEYKSVIRLDIGKGNLTPAGGSSTWRRLVSVPLGNGDEVGVVDAFVWPNPEDFKVDATPEQTEEIRARLVGQVGRADKQAKQWAGHVVLSVLGIDPAEKTQWAKAEHVLTSLIEAGQLEVQDGRDDHHKPRKYIVAT